MPTNNPKISAYVSQTVFDRFEQFQKERKLSMSQAVAVILIEYFGLQESIEKPTIGGVTLDSFQDLQETVKILLDRVNLLEDYINKLDISLSEKSLGNDGLYPQNIKETTRKTTKETTIVNQLTLDGLNESFDEIDFPPISGTKLSQFRFNLNKHTLNDYKKRHSDLELIAWTQERDPDGIAWKQVETPVKGYVPVGNPPSELLSKLLAWRQQYIDL